MKHLLSSLLVLASMSVGSLAQAQQAKVIKVKGQQAIVQFPNGVAPVIGEMIPVGGEAVSERGEKSSRASREHLLAIIGSIYFFNNSATSNSTTGFSAQGRYGWNLETFEFGPLGEIDYSSTTGQSDRTLLGGGFFDFNFVPNKPGNEMIYGVGATADIGQVSSTKASIESTTSQFDLFAGGNLKWFGLSDNVALRGDAGFSMTRTTFNGQNTTISGLLIKGGLAFYF
jgi:hypothetical protein